MNQWPAILPLPMSGEQQEDGLDELADALGVCREYHDGIGQPRRASAEAVMAIARSLGTPIEQAAAAPEALRGLHEERSLSGLPPIVASTAGEDAGHRTEFTIPWSGCAPRSARLLLETGQVRPVNVEVLPDRTARVRTEAGTPIGYHHLEIEDSNRLQRVRVLIAPHRMPQPTPGWGLFAPLYGVRSAARGGRDFATYQDLARLGHWMANHGGKRGTAFLGTLPLLACFFEEPFEPSPYSPISRAFWSELYVDPERAPEYRRAASTPDSPTSLVGERIDYRVAMRERRAAIEALLHTLDAHGDEDRRNQFEATLEADDDLARYAAFRASVERYGSTWESWPERARSGQLRAGVDYDGEAFRYHAYAQWLAREQIAAAAAESPAGLYLDLPVGSHGGGYDTWRYGKDFVHGVAAGAPADCVFEGGQNWGFPPLHPHQARNSGYAGWRAALRHHFAHASILRVDHVMGLHRMFCIPDGFTAADGVYLHYRAEELWGILAIEASRARGGLGAAVVGEDLGTVPDAVRHEMDDRGALRMHVIPFELRDDVAAPITSPSTNALTCLGTHDMETFAGWMDQPSAPRQQLAAFLGCEGSSPAVQAALLRWMSTSDAALVCANLEDLWLEHERQNLPGTDASFGNWQRPFSKSFEEFTQDEAVNALLGFLSGGSVKDSE